MRKQARDEAGEDVAGAGGGEGGVAGLIHIDTLRVGDDGVLTLEHNDRAVIGGECRGGVLALGRVGRVGGDAGGLGEATELAGVWR